MSDRPEPRYPNVARWICDTPWAIQQEKLEAILEMATFRVVEGGRYTPAELEARTGPRVVAPSRAGVASSVAVIPIHGTIVPRADLMTEMSGGTTAESIAAMVNAAAADPGVSAIVLDLNSPGGAVGGIPEAAAAIRAAADVKPVVSVASPLAASAAYWLGSQATEMVAAPSAFVGSIGVITAHMDNSGRLAQAGITPTIITAGKFKAEGNPMQPLSAEGAADMQGIVDEFYGMFVGDVARGRGVSPEAVATGFGEGRVVTASTALAEGMIDRVGTLEETITGLLEDTTAGDGAAPAADRAKGWTPTTRTATTIVDAARLLADDARALTDRTATLAETRRGDLSVAKRDALSEAHRELAASVTAIADMLAASDPSDDGSATLARVELAGIRRRHIHRQEARHA